MTPFQAQTIQVPLTPTAHQLALQYAAEQTSPAKGKQVYLNTLAICAVHDYLQWLQIESDLSQTDAANPHLRAFFNVADLVIPDRGKIECRPVLPGEMVITLPSETTIDRLGYVAVQFSEALDQVELLGFAPPLPEDAPESLSIPNLQPIEMLLHHLVAEAKESEITTPAAVQSTEPHSLDQHPWLNISDWLQGEFTAGWQKLESLLGSGNLAYAMRNVAFRDGVVVNGGKILTCNIDLHQEQFILQISQSVQPDQRVKVLVRLRRYDPDDCLPPKMQLSHYSEAGILQQEPVLSIEPKNYIQLKPFTIPRGKRFRIQVAHQGIVLNEEFVTL